MVDVCGVCSARGDCSVCGTGGVYFGVFAMHVVSVVFMALVVSAVSEVWVVTMALVVSLVSMLPLVLGRFVRPSPAFVNSCCF